MVVVDRDGVAGAQRGEHARACLNHRMCTAHPRAPPGQRVNHPHHNASSIDKGNADAAPEANTVHGCARQEDEQFVVTWIRCPQHSNGAAHDSVSNVCTTPEVASRCERHRGGTTEAVNPSGRHYTHDRA